MMQHDGALLRVLPQVLQDPRAKRIHVNRNLRLETVACAADQTLRFRLVLNHGLATLLDILLAVFERALFLLQCVVFAIERR